MTSHSSEFSFLNCLFEGKYRVSQQLGKGSCGTVYKAYGVLEQKEVALKIGHKSGVKPSELVVMKTLSSLSGFPEVFNAKTVCGCRFISMQLLGQNIHTIAQQKPMKLRGVGRMFLSILKRLKAMHKRGLVHRNLKPANFVYDLAGKKLYLTGLNLSMRYSGSRPYSIEISELGNPLFCSLRAHYYKDTGPSDDLESLTYIAISLLPNSLPWKTVKNTDCGLDTVRQLKENALSSKWFRSLPAELGEMLTFLRSCPAGDLPDFNYLGSLMKQLCDKAKAISKPPHLGVMSLQYEEQESTIDSPLISTVNPSIFVNSYKHDIEGPEPMMGKKAKSKRMSNRSQSTTSGRTR
mmetsp:Transcript_34710/g.61052  ORF Transcript_34710/g.61052 Transcript_34710/m.61052 type:complete len:350 (+) Transcript_34710:2741-3790(+)